MARGCSGAQGAEGRIDLYILRLLAKSVEEQSG